MYRQPMSHRWDYVRRLENTARTSPAVISAKAARALSEIHMLEAKISRVLSSARPDINRVIRLNAKINTLRKDV